MLNQSDLLDLSTEELVELARAGTDDAFRELHRRFHRRLVLGLQLSVPADVAEDAAQEAWVRAYERLADLDRRSSFFAWLATIARNSAKTILRRPERRLLTLDPAEEQAADAHTDPYRAAELHEREEAARLALGRLPEQQRRVLELRWIEGWSYRAIARRLGRSLSAVETLLYRARSNFHKQFESALSGVEASDDVACYKIRSQIRRLHQGQLTERRRSRVLNHLARCLRCRTVHEQMGEGWEARSWAPLLLPAGFRDFLGSLAARLTPLTSGAAPGTVQTLGSGLALGLGGLVTGLTLSADGLPGAPHAMTQESGSAPTTVERQAQPVDEIPAQTAETLIVSEPSPAALSPSVVSPDRLAEAERIDRPFVPAAESVNAAVLPEWSSGTPSQEEARSTGGLDGLLTNTLTLTNKLAGTVITGTVALTNQLAEAVLGLPVVETVVAGLHDLVAVTLPLVRR